MGCIIACIQGNIFFLQKIDTIFKNIYQRDNKGLLHYFRRSTHVFIYYNHYDAIGYHITI